MNSYEARTWTTVAQLLEVTGSDSRQFIEAMVDLVVRETRRSFGRGIKVGRGEMRKATGYRSALKNGKLQPKQKVVLEEISVEE